MRGLPKPVRAYIKAAIALIIIALVLVNPAGSAFGTALNSTEVYAYHVRDLVDYLSGYEDEGTPGDLYISTGTYEQTKDGPLFGAAEGMNLMVIQVESLQNLMIGRDYCGQEFTPCLNDLIDSEGTFYFDNYFQSVGSGNTSDAEFASNNSMMGCLESFTYQLFQDNYFRGLPWLLREKGYKTAVFHGYEKSFWNRENIYPKLGFEKFYGDTEFVNDHIEGIGGGNIVGISDHAFYEQTMDYIESDMKEPFYSFIISLSNHNPFRLPEDLKEIELRPSEQSIVGNYMNAVRYTDKCLGELFDMMKENGLWDNTLIAIYGDHFGLSKSDPAIAEAVSGWLGTEYRYDMMLNIPLIIRVPGVEEHETLHTAGGQIDLLPTLAYLMGFDTLDTIYLGQNLFTAEDGGLAPIQTHMIKGSFVSGDMVFEMSRDGVFENGRAWSRTTGEELDFSGAYDKYLKSKSDVELTEFYLYNDILREYCEEGRDADSIIRSFTETRVPERELGCVYVESGDSEALADFWNGMLENGGRKVLLASDDPEKLLSDLELEYSGKTGRVGEIKLVDEEANALFNDVRSRIVPFLKGTEGYTKIGYLGYDDIMVYVDDDEMTPEKTAQFIAGNEPYGIALPYYMLPGEKNRLLATGVPVYVYGTDSPATLAFAKALGVYGVIRGSAEGWGK